ncbi:hypothetical protein JW756_02970, partial [Candidatus Woesearchaeota archaeon]|nr:hypothetical protein [Candidatus Woesearchaeota archaeon]
IENTSYSPLGEVLTGGNQTRYDYEGKESDSVIGDTDFNARRYKPDLGIFEQPDTLIQNVYDPQSLNRYMFERGNPYKNKDETGHFWQIPVISGILFALYGGIGETVTQITITGRVYSWQRIASATGTNFVIGAAIGGIGLIPYVGIPLAGVALYVYAIYSDVSTAESVKAAQEQKALDKLQEEEKEKTEEGETMKTMTEVNPPVDYNKLSSFESRTQAALRRIILGEGDLMDYSLANRNPDIYWAVYNPDIGKWEPPPPKPIPTPNPMP